MDHVNVGFSKDTTLFTSRSIVCSRRFPRCALAYPSVFEWLCLSVCLLSLRTRCNITFDHCRRGPDIQRQFMSTRSLHQRPTVRSTMALTKDKHYWTQLRTATTAGQWDSDFPGKDRKGNTLNWANLLRKFNKHCPGQNEFAEVISQTHHLYLQLAAGQQKSATDSSQRSQASPLDLCDNTILPEERQQEGLVGYDGLHAIPSPSEVSLTKSHIYFRPNQIPSQLCWPWHTTLIRFRAPLNPSISYLKSRI